jgi:hypothetical protein
LIVDPQSKPYNFKNNLYVEWCKKMDIKKKKKERKGGEERKSYIDGRWWEVSLRMKQRMEFLL